MMKHYSILISIFLTIVSVVRGQDPFAPLGAKWKYPWYNTTDYKGDPNLYLDTNVTNTITAIKDTLLLGKNCRKLSIQRGGGGGCYIDFNFVYSDSGRVYFYDAGYASWQLLFDINKNIGDSFIQNYTAPYGSIGTISVSVTATSTININGKTLKVIDCSDKNRYIENIGCTLYFFPFYDAGCNEGKATQHFNGKWGGLKCYFDSTMGIYGNCDSIITAQINRSGTFLVSASATGNQWYLNDTAISGATSQTYTATKNGSYTLIVTINGISTPASSAVIISNIKTAVEMTQDSIDSKVSIYPNPNNGIFTLQSVKKISSIKVTNILGATVLLQQINANTAIIDLSNEPNGNYFIKIISEQGTPTYTKIILTH